MKHFLYTLLAFVYVEFHPRVIWLDMQKWWLGKQILWIKSSTSIYEWENAKMAEQIKKKNQEIDEMRA